MKTGNKLIRYRDYHFLKYNSLMDIDRAVKRFSYHMVF